MSSPIAIPRAAQASAAGTTIDALSASATSSSSSLTSGKYIPVHKRTGATATPVFPSSSRSSSPSRSWRNKRSHPSAHADDVYNHIHNDIPLHITIPNIYSIADLLTLSTATSTTTSSLSETQLSNIQQFLPFTYGPLAAQQPSSSSASHRRRRGNHRGNKKAAPRPIVAAPEDVHEHRRRHGWGWHPMEHAEESWRHDQQALPAPIAVHV